ncbi:hypothetical protein [Angustibacter luteus]|uniref:XRE family transcriptional regulator n=1 Tax=Angustibacter luteus TaxID=658456 RepID=A0ABW1JCF2_9ACTN
MKRVGDLQQLVERRLRELGDHRGPMPTRRAAARSEGKVSYETLRLLKLGQHSGAISAEVAEGLALALDVPLTTVLEVAGQRIPLGPFVLPKRAETLTKAERAAVLSVVDAILGAAGQDRTAIESLRPVAKGGGRSGGTQTGSRQAGATARRVRKGQDPLR